MPARAHTPMQLAMRDRLLSLVVCTTGSMSLAATATGYTRSSGSFITDGFADGMELTPSGFSDTSVCVIAEGGVSALSLTVVGTRTVQAAASGRALTVGLPSLRAWENEDLTPIAPRPYVDEQYIPGPAFVPEVGTAARKEVRPMYSPRIYVRSNTGILANGRYADAIVALFPPGLELTSSDGTVIGVKSDTAPFVGQRLPGPIAGWSVVPVTIPFYTRN